MLAVPACIMEQEKRERKRENERENRQTDTQTKTNTQTGSLIVHAGSASMHYGARERERERKRTRGRKQTDRHTNKNGHTDRQLHSLCWQCQHALWSKRKRERERENERENRQTTQRDTTDTQTDSTDKNSDRNPQTTTQTNKETDRTQSNFVWHCQSKLLPRQRDRQCTLAVPSYITKSESRIIDIVVGMANNDIHSSVLAKSHEGSAFVRVCQYCSNKFALAVPI